MRQAVCPQCGSSADVRTVAELFDGGSRSAPITEIRMPITLAEADAIVDRLRAP